MCTSIETSSSYFAKNCGAASHLSKLCSSRRSAMKSTQHVPARLRPYNFSRNRQNTEVGFPNAACYSSHSVGGFASHSSSSSMWKYALVTSAMNVIRRLGTQVVDDASRARSGARRKHIVHCFTTLELSRNKSCTDSVSPVVRSPACCHSLLAGAYSPSRTLHILRVVRIPSAGPSSNPQSSHGQQEGPAIFQRLHGCRHTLHGPHFQFQIL